MLKKGQDFSSSDLIRCTNSKSSFPENRSFFFFFIKQSGCVHERYIVYFLGTGLTLKWDYLIGANISWHAEKEHLNQISSFRFSLGWVCSQLFKPGKSQTQSLLLPRHSVAKAERNRIQEATTCDQLWLSIGKVPGFVVTVVVYLFIYGHRVS